MSTVYSRLTQRDPFGSDGKETRKGSFEDFSRERDWCRRGYSREAIVRYIRGAQCVCRGLKADTHGEPVYQERALIAYDARRVRLSRRCKGRKDERSKEQRCQSLIRFARDFFLSLSLSRSFLFSSSFFLGNLDVSSARFRVST